MEQTKDNTEEYVRRIITPIFNKVLKEMPKNHVSVGGVGINKDYSYAFYNPHNARYYFNFNKSNFTPNIKGGVGSLELMNKSEYCHKDFMGCRVVVKKTQIEITNKIDKDRIFKIDGSSKNRNLQVIEACATLEKESINVLYNFIKLYGGSSNYKCIKSWIPDNKITHDKIIDSIDIKQTFRNDVVKRVYNETPSNIELSDPVFTSNLLRNMGLHDYAPELVEAIENIHLDMTKREALVFLKCNVRKIKDIFYYKDYINLLSNDEKEEFSNWTFNNIVN